MVKIWLNSAVFRVNKINPPVFYSTNSSMKNSSLISISVLFLFIGACSPSLSPFTQRLIEQNRWSEKDLKKIQFYSSAEILLYRDYASGMSRIESGEIKMVKGRKVEEIRIPKGTPGVAVFQPKSNRLAVSFEDQKDRFLIFGPNPKRGNSYVLLASEWKNRRGKVKYDDQQYFTTTESAFATLLVDVKKSKKIKVKSRSVKGRKID